jgi:hypothetical protein
MVSCASHEAFMGEYIGVKHTPQNAFLTLRT